jgi:lipopolysaccharide transport system ATP-binding protein
MQPIQLIESVKPMNSPVIKVENLSKQYRLGAAQGYKTFREAIVKAAKAPFRNFRKSNPQSAIDSAELVAGRNPQSDTIWALKDVSFEVKQGEVIGIIGRNGAGKSTLLKILSKITEPTSGRVELKGRVGSLLEVGTGFHPELSGHENIYLYGAILGMDRWEVTRKFDEIVAFAEIEKFIDTPVKRYSSGMYMRLAFAVAAHLDPEILLVDEILAVGDISFQKKCLGKMDDVSKKGRTVFFVSHNMTAIQNLCERVLLLDTGRIIENGPVQDVIRKYINTNLAYSEKVLSSRSDRTGNGLLRFIDYKITNRAGDILNTAIAGEMAKINISYKCIRPLRNVNIGIAVKSSEGYRLSSLAASLLNKIFKEIPKEGVFIFEIPRFPFNIGSYFILLDANIDGTTLDRLDFAFRLDVETGVFYRNGKLPAYENKFLVDFSLSVKPL